MSPAFTYVGIAVKTSILEKGWELDGSQVHFLYQIWQVIWYCFQDESTKMKLGSDIVAMLFYVTTKLKLVSCSSNPRVILYVNNKLRLIVDSCSSNTWFWVWVELLVGSETGNCLKPNACFVNILPMIIQMSRSESWHIRCTALHMELVRSILSWRQIDCFRF